MENFAAIDFETANGSRSSVCSVGVVVVREGEVVDRYYAYFCQRVHGLSRRDTCNAPTFPEVWAEIEERIYGLPLVAHNARFDESCLRAVFDCYDMRYPGYTFYDTLAASRQALKGQVENHQLHTVAAACGYCLEDHHHALADAEACAAIALKLL